MKVVIVDDEPVPTNYYLYALKMAGFDALVFGDVDEAAVAFQEWFSRGDMPAVVILDVMMPPGQSFARADTAEGLRTGLVFYLELRRKWPAVPMIALTHAQLTEGQFDGDPNAKVVSKVRCPPMDLVELVRGLLGR